MKLKLTCQTCGKEFTWNQTSTIKPKDCRKCTNQKLIKKANWDKPKPIKEKKKKRYANWEDKPLPQLIKHVQERFCNPYIRERDIENFGKCISCNSGITQAGHRYSIGDFPAMRFLIHNLHGQEVSCNMHKSGNIDFYDWGLKARHGEEYVNRLRTDAESYLRNGHQKMLRYDVIMIGRTYKYLLENKIWVFTPKEFNKHRDEICKN